MKPDTPTLSALLPTLAELSGDRQTRIPLEKIAARAGRSPWHFQRTFTRLAGESPARYTRRLRLEYAAARLLGSTDSVLDIALGVGFDSHDGFTRAFARHFDCTPNRYRARGRAAGLADDPRHARLIESLGPCLHLYRADLGPAPDPQETSVSYAIDRKTIDASTVLCQRERASHAEVAGALGRMLPAIFTHAMKSGAALVGPPVARYLEHNAAGITVEAGLPVAPGAEGTDSIDVAEWPGGEAAVTVHTGPYETLGKAHEALESWLADKDLKIGGPPREVYLTDPGEVPDPAAWQTLVIWPIG